MPDRGAATSLWRIPRLLREAYATAAGTVTASPDVRKMAALTAINAFGNGAFATVSAIFYTQVLGFSIAFVSLALTVATLVAIAGDLISGSAADRYSPRPVLMAGLLVSGGAAVALSAVHGSTMFLLVILLSSLGQGMCMSANTALIRRVARENPAAVRASLRSIMTLALSLGAVIGGAALGAGGRGPLSAVIIVNAGTFVLAAALLARIRVPAMSAGAARRPAPARPDRRFAVFAVANGMIGIYLHVLPFALPLWMARRHPELLWTVGAAVAGQALATAVLQVPASHGIRSVPAATHRLLIGAGFVASSYLFFLLTVHPTAGVLVALAVFLLLHTVGEVLCTAGSMELLFRLAPEERQGRYGAFAGVSNGVISSLAPLVLGFALTTSSGGIWLVMAAATMALAGVISRTARPPLPTA